MKCKLCNSNCSLLADLGQQPLANKYPSNDQEFSEEKFWNLQALICDECFCGQLNQIIDRSEMFEDYYYLSSVNHELNEHFKTFAKYLSKFKFVLDVGSNDGILLRPLRENGTRCLGIDPSVNVGKIANDEGLETIVDFFNYDSAIYIKNEYGKPDAIVASSIFTHLENPKDFTSAMESLISDDGEIFIEIEYLANLIDNFQFERFYFDRPFYYSVTSMKKIFEECNLFLNKVEEIAPHGGSLRLCFSKSNKSNNLDSSVNKYLELEKIKLTKENISVFQSSIDNFSEELVKILKSNRDTKIAGFGAPARLATITNFAKIDSELISYVVDDSPLKVGKYSPGMHIPILSRENMLEHKPDLIVVFAYEYIDSIYEFTKQFNCPHYQPIPPRLIK